MLLGQQLGGGHHSPLGAALGAPPQAEGGDGGFSRANVPLDQTVHGDGFGEVGGALADDLFLRPGEGEGEQGREGRRLAVGERQTGKAFPVPAQQGET